MNSKVEKYRHIKESNKLSYSELKIRMEQDKLKRSQISNILDEIWIEEQSEKERKRKRREETMYFLVGTGLILLSLTLHYLASTTSWLKSTQGTGRNELNYLVYEVVIFGSGIYLLAVAKHRRK